ncbi:putative membrane protein [Mycobacterium lepraemurium]|nr:putative membrane protein [Mycobacterium lepraemurium]
MRIAAVLGVLAGLAVLTGPVTPRAVAGEPGVTPFVRVRIDQVTPDVVTTTSPPVVTVSGTVTNIGDRLVRNVMVRLEHAGPVTASAGLRTSLDGDTDQYQAAADFLTVAPELQRGQEVSFTLSAPLRALTKQSLGVEKPGIYPVLVNVNGTPDYGAPARLDNARFLLPVVGVPPDRADDLGSAVAPDTSKPVGITMLWPLADRPRLAPGVPGGTIPVRLVDDDLANSLASGGRLDILLAAAEVATSHDVDPDGAVGRALCLAVDPDLLVTVNAMTAGYVVSDSPDGPARPPGTPTHPGTGQATATEWLNRLRALAHRTCVAPLPYAQADLDALQRVNAPGLSNTALTSVNSIVDKILDVPSTRGAALMPNGRLTGWAVKLLGASQTTVAVTAADLSAGDAQGSSETSVDTAPRRVSPQVVAVPFDPAVGAALAGAGVNPEVPTYLDSSLTVRLAHDSVTARRQDALGSMFWHALRHDDTPRTQLLVPPATWNLQADDAQVILTALTTSIRSGLAVPRPLPAVIGEANQAAQTGAPPANEVSADGSALGQFNDDVTGAITGQVGRLWGLTSALMTDDRTGLTGVQYTAPLREDMLRALSQSEPPDSRNGLAQQRLAVVGKTINDLFGAVTIVNPGGSYTLATEHSPLPLALHNGLAVPIRVRVHVDAPPGMNVTDVGVIELPPGYLPLRIPIEVNFTQRVAVDVTLRTADGMRLGEPVRLSVHSNAYGKVLFAITLSAAAVLVLLAGRRLWHRFRGQPDRADLDRPDPPEARHANPRVEQEHRV